MASCNGCGSLRTAVTGLLPSSAAAQATTIDSGRDISPGWLIHDHHEERCSRSIVIRILRRSFAALAVSGVCLCGYARTSEALTVTVTYTGTVASGAYATDTAGLFGPKGGDLSGKAFTANLSYDVKFDGTYDQINNPFEQSLEGGPVATNPSFPSPSLGAWITINGQVQSSTGNLLGYIDEYADISGTAGMSDDAFGTNSLRFSSAINGPFGSLPIPSGIETPFSYTFTSRDSVAGFFDGAGHSIVLVPVNVTEILGTVPAPTTPLPAALPLFASGIAGAGLLCWRRKRRSAPKA